jgi:hypothetical protein
MLPKQGRMSYESSETYNNKLPHKVKESNIIPDSNHSSLSRNPLKLAYL